MHKIDDKGGEEEREEGARKDRGKETRVEKKRWRRLNIRRERERIVRLRAEGKKVREFYGALTLKPCKEKLMFTCTQQYKIKA